MKFKETAILCCIALLALGNYSCKKAVDAVPIPSGVPGLIIAQPDGTDIAQGYMAKFDMTLTSTSDLKELKISKNIEGTTTWTVIKDSTFPAGQRNPQFNYFYTVPDNEPVGEKINFKFSLTNNNDTKEVTSSITVKAATPAMDITQDHASINLGDSVKFTIVAGCTVAITELKIMDSLVTLKDIKYTIAQNKQSFVSYYSYIPTSKGNKTLTFILTNKNSQFLTKREFVTVN